MECNAQWMSRTGEVNILCEFRSYEFEDNASMMMNLLYDVCLKLDITEYATRCGKTFSSRNRIWSARSIKHTTRRHKNSNTPILPIWSVASYWNVMVCRFVSVVIYVSGVDRVGYLQITCVENWPVAFKMTVTVLGTKTSQFCDSLPIITW